MSVITLHVAYAQDVPVSRSIEIFKKRKFIASPTIFTFTDVIHSQPEWHARRIDIDRTFPEAAKLMDEYRSLRDDGDDMRDIERYSERRARMVELRAYPFILLGKRSEWLQIALHHWPDIKIQKVQSPHHSTELLMDQIFWPSITIRSIDHTEETLYFFSVAEAEEALRLIQEGINNGI